RSKCANGRARACVRRTNSRPTKHAEPAAAATTSCRGRRRRAPRARLARGAVAQREVTDAAITAALSAGWSLSRLGRIVLAILRVGGYEILAVEGVPRAVSINEYVDIAHAFFADKEPAFVNGVLDRLARDAAGADEPGPQSDGVG
ncbi:MAG: transcription antitermination factor NusB, partial [Pseudomonadota bacterium]|nr:transcription antitermination factor NusB [Pseudomonadota bacterium]